MKYPIRYFSIGLFTASLIVLIGYILAEPKSTKIDETVDGMIESVEKEGYRVITESEYISLATSKNELNAIKKEQDDSSNKNDQTTDQEKNASEEDKSPKKDDKKDDETKDNEEKSDKNNDEKNKEDNKDKDKNKTVKYTLVVEQNMVPSEISKTLEKEKIIKDALDFNQYMESNNYSPYLQIGEFELTSDMSHKEIAKAITGR